jgi:aminoglycoside N3'-acetyltransferase
MGGCETNVMVGGSFTAMERVVLTANGNLQRIMRYFSVVVTQIFNTCLPASS